MATSIADAAVIAQHIGSSDPTTEGWTASVAATSIVGPVASDPVGGLAAWKTNDPSVVASSFAGYQFNVSTSDANTGITAGWTLTARMRVVGQSDTADGGILMLFRDGTRSWQLHFGDDASGNVKVIAFDNTNSNGTTGVSAIVAGNGYHLYAITYDKVAHNVDVFADGVQIISNNPGFALVQSPNLFFGSGSSAATGESNWNSVQFSIVTPEPSAFAPLIASLAMFRRRKRNV